MRLRLAGETFVHYDLAALLETIPHILRQIT